MIDNEEQEPPFSIQVELTEGCNLRCTFCGINGIRGKEMNFKFMSTETAQLIATQVKDLRWNPRFEFAMRGEPSMNKQMIQIIKIFRDTLPKVYLMMLSNGGGLVGDLSRIDALFDAGLNCLGIDVYDHVNLGRRIRDGYDGPVTTYEYPAHGPQANVHQREQRKRLVFIQSLDAATTGNHKASQISNHAGSAGPFAREPLKKQCSRPFREIAVRADGSAALCCVDWRGAFTIGSVHSNGLKGMWNNSVIKSARRALYHGDRDFSPCKGCTDNGGHRLGLLPDKKGQLWIPPADARDKQRIEDAAAGKPMTKPVLRPWETTV